ncbi:glycosyl transferase family 2 [Acerihabitans sp. KWT182]|uniref:Glycosyl transferase family 2 n=1 Tax=Acerihabitans sp. KWT182 TaxID=3157919 RepID=A0AAU7Q662_9GAMM
MKNESFLSVTFVVRESISLFKEHIIDILMVLEDNFTDYEIVIIRPGPYIANTMDEDKLMQEVPCMRLIQLSANVQEDIALGVGLENSIGDFVILWNCKKDPPDIIPCLVNISKSGYDIILGVSDNKNTFFYSLIRKLSKHLLSLVDYSLPENTTNLRCLSRRTVNTVTKIGRFHHQLMMRIQKSGYPFKEFSYTQRYCRSTNNIFGAFRSLLRLMIFNSSKPLRLMSMVGFIGSVIAFIFAGYSIIARLLIGHIVDGWTTTIFFMSFLFMLQFVMLAFFWRIYRAYDR